MKKKFLFFFSLSILCLFIFAAKVSAHEVYVLSPQDVRADIAAPAFSTLQVIKDNLHQFTFWTFISVFLVLSVFFISISRRLEDIFDPIFVRLRKHASFVGRLAIGSSFFFCAYFLALYGPEIPMVSIFGDLTPFVAIVLVIVGILMIIGVWDRLAALISIFIYIVAFAHYGLYMLSYTTYLGKSILILIEGDERHKKIHLHHKDSWLVRNLKILKEKLLPFRFLILRVSFGISLLYASLYAKFIHNQLALEVVLKYHLTNYFPFEPHFFVVGAGIVEIVIALFFIFGIEIRFTAVFLEFWLTLSVLFFGESVWPHIILFITPIVFIMYGYDKYSIEGFLFKKKDREPVF